MNSEKERGSGKRRKGKKIRGNSLEIAWFSPNLTLVHYFTLDKGECIYTFSLNHGVSSIPN